MIVDFPEKTLLPGKTIFKKGAYFFLVSEALEFGKRGLIVHGHSLKKGNKLNKILNQSLKPGKIEFFCRGSGEPTLDEVKTVIARAKSIKAEWIMGVGGGSVLDLAKAAAGLFNAREEPEFYQEKGKLEEKGIPFIAVPTTAGTGSEATSNSVIINKKKNIKRSIRNESFLAKKVILDVKLLESLPPKIISYSGMDAFIQAYESFISKNSSWLSETLALKAIELINTNILKVYSDKREENLSGLLLGSYLAGLALSHSRLGVIHGIAHPLGAIYNQPHGLICSVCLLPSIKLNRKVLAKKYQILSRALRNDLLERAEALIKSLNIISPFKGKTLIKKEKIIKETLLSGSTAANPKKISRKDVEFMLEKIF